MKHVVVNLYYWSLDYLYVVTENFSALFNTHKLEQYRTNGGAPVILIPGVYESWRFMRPIAETLHSHGYDVHVIEGLGRNRGTIEAITNVVKAYIKENKLSNINLVAHSKGGLVGKYLLSIFRESTVFNGLIALNAPFSGSRYAYILPLRSLRIFTPKSTIILTLAKDETVNSRIVSIYGIFDPHIPGGSKLNGAKNIQLNTYGHFRIMKSAQVHEAILKSMDGFM